MHIIICKFGGTSVSSRATWDNILRIAQSHIAEKRKPIIVCSAFSQASNRLEKAIEAALTGQHQTLAQSVIHDYTQLAKELAVAPAILDPDITQLRQWLEGIALLQEAPAKIRAQIMSLGELMMSKLGQAFLQQSFSGVSLLDARHIIQVKKRHRDAGLHYLAARAQSNPDAKLIAALNKDPHPVAITQGFIAADEEGHTVLLGRGGSDTSAALIAANCQAKGCEIWTDVPGIYTANPYQLPNARLLKQLNYHEAQEIASMGAKVLHPNSIPPVRNANIPLWVKYTRLPEHSGTLISSDRDEQAPPIKSIQVKHQVLLISIDTTTMWQEVGFLADVFMVFKEHGFSVDLLSSSEFNITVSLDSNAKLRERGALNRLLEDLQHLGKARLIEPCSAVSLVGHPIRTILPELGPTLAVFEAQQVHMMCLASNDLNLTFVVDESQADKLCQKLHALLIENNPQSYYYSKSWQEEFGQHDTRVPAWWEKKREQLLAITETTSPCYVYDLASVQEKAQALLTMQAIDTLYYAMKANPNPDILRTLHQAGIAFECVSQQEIEHLCQHIPDIQPERILFTPNFAARSEYEFALDFGCYVTIDNSYVLQQWPEIFRRKPVLLRIDPGSGAGHHKYVCTGGNESKFGIVREDIDSLLAVIAQYEIQVIGLHAHSGSGILSPEQWQQTALMLVDLSQYFPEVRIINCGGGLGVVEKPWQTALDLQAVNAGLQAVKDTVPHLQFWLEPGRYYVAEAGVLLAKVTQLKQKGNVRFIGLETGMNSLLRPALYGAWHEIVNLTRLNDEKQAFHHIVGPICESGDTLGYDRLLPATQEQDVMLIATAGAYGYCMRSAYNLRPAAIEYCLPCP
ncbi:MAG: bifunctional aspartate kinase/diaminopimelate decarboxylase [Legionellaceae bacterium]|nr:bifunctional aspartate kinase/diaminopimelate decarboxylase [Legionellaceae bacterium]